MNTFLMVQFSRSIHFDKCQYIRYVISIFLLFVFQKITQMATNNGTTTRYSDELSSLYNYIFTEIADKRTNSWFLITDPKPFAVILLLWIYFVLQSGPKMMNDRKPYELRQTLIVYNFIQVLLSSYVFIRGGQLAWFGKYSWRCEPVDFSNSEHGMEIAKLCYVYFLVKLTELLDTVFFVLRKKNNQITFLHMYHHAAMPALSWGCVKYLPGGHATIIGFLNSFVHVIMYSYYLLSAFGPNIQKYLWWKKYITTIQLLQFCMIFIHNCQLFFYDCGYPLWAGMITMPNCIFFYFLFIDFYRHAYANKNKSDALSESISQMEVTNKSK